MTEAVAAVPTLAAQTSVDPARPAERSAWFALGVLVIVTVFAAIDRQILTIAIEPIRVAFALSDLQIGLMQGLGMTLVAAFAAFPLAWLSDRFDRRFVLAACTLAWSAATAARGFAHDFDSLLAGTVGLAVAESGLGPIVYSMIPNMFSGAQRARANLVYYAAALVGAGLGMGLAGLAFKLISAHAGALPAWLRDFEPWRIAFLATALPGLVLVVLILTIRPVHGRPTRVANGARAGARDTGSTALMPYVRRHWGTLLALFGSACASSTAFAPITAWLAPATARKFGLVPGDVGVNLGIAVGGGVVAGVALAALAVKLWGRRFAGILGIQLGQYLAAVSALAAGLLAFATAPWMVYAAAGVMLALSGAFYALMPGVWQEIAPATLRVRVIAFAGAMTTLATAAGPVLTGWLSGLLGPGADRLMVAVAVASAPLMLLSALLMRLSLQPVRRLLERVRADEAALEAIAAGE